MRTLLVLLVLVGVALAGCSTPREPATSAKTLFPAAQAHARAWHEDAWLSMVDGAEVRNGTEVAGQINGTDVDDVAFHAMLAHDDPDPTDGQAPAWRFVFGSHATNKSYIVVVAAGGGVLVAGEGRAATISRIQVDQWLLDSDRAWAFAKEHNATLRAAAAKAGAWGAEQLMQFPTDPTLAHPQWLVVAINGHGIETGLFVDAYNGTVSDLGSTLRALLAKTLPREAGQFTGDVEATASSMAQPFRLQGGYHQRLAVALHAETGSPPMQTVHVQLVGPLGNVIMQFNHTSGAGVSDPPSAAHVLAPTKGDYSIRIDLAPPGPSGIAMLYQVSVCTDGSGLPYPPPFADYVEACDYLGS
jgi:hypothetical protein